MPKYQLTEHQKDILRAFSLAMPNRPAGSEWSYFTMPSDYYGSDPAVKLNSGIRAIDAIKDIHKSDLDLFDQVGLITLITGRKAFRLNDDMICRLFGQ